MSIDLLIWSCMKLLNCGNKYLISMEFWFDVSTSMINHMPINLLLNMVLREIQATSKIHRWEFVAMSVQGRRMGIVAREGA